MTDNVERNGIFDDYTGPDKDGKHPPLTAMPNEHKQCSDEELALSMMVFMKTHGGERMLRATQAACETIAEEAAADLDGTSYLVWRTAAKSVGEAAQHLEEN